MGKKKKKKRYKGQYNLNVSTPLISICMIVRNEAKTLPECLQHIKNLADEIIVVDTGSTDKTVEIARKYDAKVYHFEWIDDFSAARNESLRHAAGKWIIWLDADDRIFPDQHAKIRKLAAQEPNKAFSFIIQNKGVDESKANQCRMFPNRSDIRFSRPVHEQVASAITHLGLKIINTDVILIHTGYSSPDVVKAKKKRYIKMMARWLEKNPNDYLIRYQYSLALQTLGHHEQAISEITKLVDNCEETYKTNPVYFYSLILLGRSYFNTQKFEEALTVFEQAQRIDPNSSFLLISKAEVYTCTKRYHEAYECLRKASDQPDASLSAFALDYNILKAGKWALQGKICLELDKMDEAFHFIRQAIDFLPEKPDGYKYMAQWYKKTGNYDKAIDYFKEASEKDSKQFYENQFYYDYQIGEIYFELGQLIDAREYYTKAIDKRSFLGAWTKLALIERGCGNYDKAIEHFKYIDQHFNRHKEVNVQTILTYLDQKNYPKARELNTKNDQNELYVWIECLLLLYEKKYDEFEYLLFANFPLYQNFNNNEMISTLLEEAEQERKENNLFKAELMLKLASFFVQDNPDTILTRLVDIQMQNSRIIQAIETMEQRIHFCQDIGEVIPLLEKIAQGYKMIGIEDAYHICTEKISKLKLQKDLAMRE